MDVAVQVLGPLRVVVDGNEVRLGGALQRRMLSALALHADHDVSTDGLADLVWGGRVPAEVPNAVQTHIRRLRTALGPSADQVRTVPSGYRLDVRDRLDAVAFRIDATRAHDLVGTDPTAAAALLDELLGRWRGDPWQELEHPDAVADAAALNEVEVAAREDRALAALAIGQHAEAIARSEVLRRHHPLRERPVEIAMRALVAAGRAADAIEVFRGHQDTMAAELGLDPAPFLQDLHVQVLRRDLPTMASPPTVPGGSPGHDPSVLPGRPSRLLGRERDLATVRRALQASSLVTIVGPGGVGKTRLALEVAHDADASTTWWCDLAAVEPTRLLSAVATTMGVNASTVPTPDVLAAILAGHRGLLCLDNAEHLLDALAVLVEAVSDRADELSMLVTSRERLALDVEALHVLAPLPPPAGADPDNPGVQLFLQRWSGRIGDQDGDDVARVADICRRLDGIPLAIELAAARASALGLDDLADRLDDRLDLLAGGRRTGDPRHQTLRTVLDWSHDLLQPTEARLYARLSVFPAAFTLAQVEAVCADDQDDVPVAGTLARLVEQSLVQRGSDGRFRLLETLRVHATEQLPATELTRLAGRHAADVARNLAERSTQLWGPDEPDAVAGLAAGVDDLHAAWSHAAETDRALAIELAAEVFWFAYFRQRLDLLAWSTTAATWELDHPRRPHVLAAAAVAEWSAGRIDQAQLLVDDAIAVAGAPTAPAAALAVDIGADLAMFRGETAQAIAGYQLSLDLEHRAGDPEGRIVTTEIALVQARSYGPDGHAVREELASLVARASATGCPTAQSFAGYVVGEATAAVDVEASRAGYEDAVRHGRRSDCRLFVGFADTALVALLAASGSIDEATAAFRRTLGSWEQVGNVAGQWTVLGSLVVLLARAGDDVAAMRILGALDAADRDGQWRAPNDHAVEQARASLVERRGVDESAQLLDEGAAMTLAETLALARQAVQIG